MTISTHSQPLSLAINPRALQTEKNRQDPVFRSTQDSFSPSEQQLERPHRREDFLKSFLAHTSGAKNLGTISHRQFQFDQGTEVVSSAQKFIIPVPTFHNSGGGEELVYPQGAKDGEGRNLAGQAIKDWQGNPIAKPGEKGVVFYNAKDRSYQAVKADGNEVIILNQVSEEQAKKLQDKLGEDPSKLSLGKFKEALTWAHEELGLGEVRPRARGGEVARRGDLCVALVEARAAALDEAADAEAQALQRHGELPGHRAPRVAVARGEASDEKDHGDVDGVDRAHDHQRHRRVLVVHVDAHARLLLQGGAGRDGARKGPQMAFVPA